MFRVLKSHLKLVTFTPPRKSGFTHFLKVGKSTFFLSNFEVGYSELAEVRKHEDSSILLVFKISIDYPLLKSGYMALFFGLKK